MKQETVKKILEKVRTDYSKISGHFSATRQAPWKEMTDFRKFVKDGDRVLDFGCGNGRLYEIFNGMSIDYTGVDNSSELVGFAKQRWGENEKRRFLVGDAANLDWWDGEKYDVIFMVAVLHHVPGEALRKAVVENIGKILKDSGTLMMINWDLFQVKYLPFIFKNVVLKIFGISDLDLRDALIPWRNPETREIVVKRYVHVFTLRELEHLVKEAGLKVVENFYSGRGKKFPWWHGRNIVTIAKK